MAVFGEFGDWTYEVFGRNTPASEFGPFESFVDLWRSRWTGDALPAWRDFAFEDFAEWYGWLFVEDVIPGGDGDVRFRLWGTSIVNLYDYEMTGKLMSEAEPGFFDPPEFELTSKIVDEGVIVRGTGSINWQNRGHKSISHIELPLSEDGKTIDKILGALQDLTPEAG